MGTAGASTAITESNDFPTNMMAQRRAQKFNLKNPVHRMRSVKIVSKDLSTLTGNETHVTDRSIMTAPVMQHQDLNLPVQTNALRQEEMSSTLSDNEGK